MGMWIHLLVKMILGSVFPNKKLRYPSSTTTSSNQETARLFMREGQNSSDAKVRLLNPYRTFSGLIISVFSGLGIVVLLAWLGQWIIGHFYPIP
jgi:hypothetical protein